jgi:hypothetical protein
MEIAKRFGHSWTQARTLGQKLGRYSIVDFGIYMLVGDKIRGMKVVIFFLSFLTLFGLLASPAYADVATPFPLNLVKLGPLEVAISAGLIAGSSACFGFAFKGFYTKQISAKTWILAVASVILFLTAFLYSCIMAGIKDREGRRGNYFSYEERIENPIK